MKLSWKTILWWSALAGIGFTVGAGLITGIGYFVVGFFQLDMIPAWLAGR